VTISTFVVALLLILWYSTKPPYIHLWIDVAPRGDFYPGYACPLWCYAINALIPNFGGEGRYWVTAYYLLPTFLAPFFYNFFADWFALIVTRRFLSYISRATNNYLIIITLVLSICAIIFIAVIGYTLFTSLVDLFIGYHIVFGNFLDPRPPIQWLGFPLYNVAPNLLGPWTVYTIQGVFLLSTLMGIFWICIFSLAVIVSNLSMKLEGVGPWLKANFYVRKHPYTILNGILVLILLSFCVIWHLFGALFAALV
jgi:hypothetical protein